VKVLEKKFLFLVVLGGRANKANIELHDVRWVIGSKIEETYESLRRDWFGSLEGLHIDSYKKIKYIDGYKINLKNFEENKITNKKLVNKIKNPQNLWFVNIGGYSPFSMQEKHEFGLVVASSELEAKNTAKSKWLIGCKKKHKDDIASLKVLTTCDDLKPIKKIGNWEIELIKVNKLVSETDSPDWYGYKKLD
tara:strand:- start:8 stop:586 length:579 start_codon:yes stop_codon:yes gene_type:complete